jgi:hypothetical protein
MSKRLGILGAVLLLIAMTTILTTHFQNSEPDGIYNFRKVCHAEGGVIIPSGHCVQQIQLEGFDK